MKSDAAAAGDNVLLLSIQKQHADRIFSGDKTFELRKILPQEPFSRVYLHETGGTGIVGFFEVARVLRLPTDQLWATVGERGTTRERFEKYFEGRKQGCAIEVARFHKFERPVTTAEIRAAHASYAVPQSFALVRPRDPLYATLRQLATQADPRATDAELSLRAIRDKEHALYSAYVQKEISRNYDEIDASFAKANLATARRGEDPFALLTLRKDVLAIERVDGVLLGFTTLTYKLGGSVKSGPTVLLPEHRRHGYGGRVRVMLEDVARQAGARKIYATAPDVSDAVLGYLLRSGMLVEAHLKAHYSDTHGEIVLGKLLAPSGLRETKLSYESRAAQVVAEDDLNASQSAQAVTLALSTYGVRVRKEHARQLVKNMGLDATYDRKPRALIALCAGTSVVAGLVLSAKRGGAMRGVLGTVTSHRPSLLRLLGAAEGVATKAGRRKLYYLHDQISPLSLEVLREQGYVTEGLLREPYMPGQDLIVVSKFLTD